jgi:hypothetical protein
MGLIFIKYIMCILCIKCFLVVSVPVIALLLQQFCRESSGEEAQGEDAIMCHGQVVHGPSHNQGGDQYNPLHGKEDRSGVAHVVRIKPSMMQTAPAFVPVAGPTLISQGERLCT